MKSFAYCSIALLVIAAIVYSTFLENSKDELENNIHTDSTKSSIDVSLIVEGGPGKDGIPALTEPKFIDAKAASSYVKDDDLGILVTHKEDARFYPYSILVWHEIVNDTFEGKHLVVTFCPLCASALVFDAEVKGETLQFGVSGKLYESNLLMYDRDTDSLWSQILGEAVVGNYTGEKLALYPFSVMSLADARNLHPKLRVLSTDTGYSRDYTFYPYGDYDENNAFYFPVSKYDSRLPAKEIIYASVVRGTPVAFVLRDAREAGTAKTEVEGRSVELRARGSVVELYDEGVLVPGFYSMWFSWAVHNGENGILWQKK